MRLPQATIHYSLYGYVHAYSDQVCAATTVFSANVLQKHSSKQIHTAGHSIPTAAVERHQQNFVVWSAVINVFGMHLQTFLQVRAYQTVINGCILNPATSCNNGGTKAV